MSEETIYLIVPDPKVGSWLEQSVLKPAGYNTIWVAEWEAGEALLQRSLPDLLILGEVAGSQAQSAGLVERYPSLPVILLLNQVSTNRIAEAFRQGFADYLEKPLQAEQVLDIVQRVIERRQRWVEQARQELSETTRALSQRLTGLEALQRIGRQVTSTLDLDNVLMAVVDAAVELTGAEEGSLLLVDEKTGDLYMRAARNFQEDFVRTFRLPIRDSLAGQVLKTSKPVLIDEKTPQKIKTAYLVYTLVYMPLIVQERVIGVLEVGNRKTRTPFSEYHITLVAALADYAAIAIENARLYSKTEVERNQLDTILAKIEEGVIVTDHEGCFIIVNHKARDFFQLGEQELVGERVQDILQHPELVEILSEEGRKEPSRTEIQLEDGRTVNAQVTPIPEVGLAVTMQDITYLKELDRIKNDFVNTVSHDLRSPLTAILGYIELIERVGPTNPQQKEFIHRVQLSVQSITALINDLLDLGRIEAGFDTRNELTPIPAITYLAIDSLRSQIMNKSITLEVHLQEGLPPVLGNPIRLRQLLGNLIGNAVKYTQSGGRVVVEVHTEAGQMILRVSDNGPGIPASDQPYIFDKFYRGSNIPNEIPGTGLGLAIVKSIVDHHSGRIWVDSVLGEGTTFTVVLPLAEPKHS